MASSIFYFDVLMLLISLPCKMYLLESPGFCNLIVVSICFFLSFVVFSLLQTFSLKSHISLITNRFINILICHLLETVWLQNNFCPDFEETLLKKFFISWKIHKEGRKVRHAGFHHLSKIIITTPQITLLWTGIDNGNYLNIDSFLCRNIVYCHYRCFFP